MTWLICIIYVYFCDIYFPIVILFVELYTFKLCLSVKLLYKVSEPPSLKVLFLDRQNDLCTVKEFHSCALQA